MEDKKRTWTEPKLIVYGSVEALTGDTHMKRHGSGDAMSVSGTTGTVSTRKSMTARITS